MSLFKVFLFVNLCDHQHRFQLEVHRIGIIKGSSVSLIENFFKPRATCVLQRSMLNYFF